MRAHIAQRSQQLGLVNQLSGQIRKTLKKPR